MSKKNAAATTAKFAARKRYRDGGWTATLAVIARENASDFVVFAEHRAKGQTVKRGAFATFADKAAAEAGFATLCEQAEAHGWIARGVRVPRVPDFTELPTAAPAPAPAPAKTKKDKTSKTAKAAQKALAEQEAAKAAETPAAA